MKKSQTLLTSLTTVGSWTVISRIFGFIRDIFIATFLGSGPVAEAFLIAFSIPNMFRTFFAEGALNLSFVPIFSKKLRDKKAAKLFALTRNPSFFCRKCGRVANRKKALCKAKNFPLREGN